MQSIRPTFAGVDFGEAVDSPIINFVTAIDLNMAEIRVPYENFETKVGVLIENYLAVTSCRNMLQGEPCFQAMQGNYQGQILDKQFKISLLGLDPQSVCFTVLRKPEDFTKKVEQSQLRFSKLSEANIVSVVLVLQGKEITYEINTKDSFAKLKAKLIAKVPEFGKYTADSIKLQHNGMFFKEEALLETYAIENGTKIIAVIKKNLGCFKRDCLVACTGDRKVPIGEIKAGDAVLSYSKQKKGLEEDRVTFVHKSILKESIVIKMTDGSEIETTANHLFLCSDDEYRMVQFEQKRQALTRGSVLKLATGQELAIEEITSKTVHPAQTFYHLCIEKNHNFIVDNFIAHNMLINIKTPNGQILKIDVNPTLPIQHIKEQLETMYYMTMENLRLNFAGKQLSNARTLSDQNISKDSHLNLLHKKLDKFNYVAGETRVLTAKGTLMPISAVKSGDEVATYDVVDKGQSQTSGRVLSILKTSIKEYVQIYFEESKTPLIVAPDSYFQLYSGEVIHAKTLSELSPASRPELKSIEGNRMVVKKILSKKYPQSREYFKLNLDNAHNYVVQSAILHDLVLHVAAMRNNKRERKISFGAHIQACTIGWAKQRVQQYTGVGVEQQVFTLNDLKLQDENELLQYDINSSQLIVATESKTKVKKTMKSSIDIEQLFQEDFLDKNFYLVLSLTEKIVINYHKYSERTVQEIMKELVPDCKSSYFFLFADLILFPDQLFSILEQSQYFKLPENEVIVVRNEKLAFIQNMSIKKSHVQNYGYIKFEQPIYKQDAHKSQIAVEQEEELTPLFQGAIGRITKNGGIEQQFKKERFYMPFLYYTSRQYDESIYRYIRFFEEHKEEVSHEDSVYCIIRNLYINMNLLPNYVGPCVCGMRNFRFSRFFGAEKVFYWHSFTSARRNEKEIVRDLKGQSGTLFYVNSLTGKDIKSFSLYPDEGEILFPPFSYFLVVKVEQGKGEEMDRVWLDEMPSPITFQKNIVLWVDDFPKNNIREINSIMALKDVEVLQLTSTVMAEKWVKQFGWLLSWKGLEFKIISDMARFEGLDRVDNKQAGIDLVQKLTTKNGYTAETLIYCGNAERARNLANARSLSSKYYSITEDELQVQKFCEIIQK